MVGPVSSSGLVCPACRSPLPAATAATYTCGCGARFAMQDGSPLFAAATAASDRGYDPELFARLAEAEAGNFWFRNRNALILRALDDHFPGGGDLLELGCGTGYVLQGIAAHTSRFRLHGSELHLEGLAFARARVPSASFYQVDARRLPFRQRFAVIGAFDVLEHIEEDQLVLRELWEALEPGGGLLVTVPQHRWLWTEVDAASGHQRRYTWPELRAKVLAAGFELLYSTSFMSALLPALWLQRSLQRVQRVRRTRGAAAGSEVIMRQFALGARTNELLLSVLEAERALLRVPGLRLPIGSSRLLVARRPELRAR